MTHRFQRSNQTISFVAQGERENMIKSLESARKTPLCSTRLCLAYDLDRGRCLITDTLSNENSKCIPDSRSSVER